jgi:ATP-dependent Clp protease ATP-binding subunit ClpA
MVWHPAVGKTELAKALPGTVCADKPAPIWIDMSEYMSVTLSLA